MGNPERNPETNPGIVLERQLEITEKTTWEEFKARLADLQVEFPCLNLNHFGDYPEDDRLMGDWFELRICNARGELETDRLLQLQSEWANRADQQEGFLKRRGNLVVLITSLTLSPEDMEEAEKRRKKKHRAYRPRLKDERR